jgi:hypothetical protein
MTEKWGSCNLAGMKKIMRCKAGLFNCRVSGLLEPRHTADRQKRAPADARR